MFVFAVAFAEVACPVGGCEVGWVCGVSTRRDGCDVVDGGALGV